jgi:hypothetical protein
MTDQIPHCLNCGAGLVGQYCGQCGQRARSRLISMWELTRDAFGDLFELDSRLWRTLIPLLARPGRLTRDYLEGRRARYMPPFRMYLVLSLVFFLIAFFDPHDDFELLFEPDAATEPAGSVDADEEARLAAAREEGRREMQDALDELVREGIIDESLIGPDGPIVLPEDGAPVVVPEIGTPPPPPESELPDEGSGRVNFTVGDTGAIDCDRNEFDLTDLPRWLQRRLTPERLERLCARWEAAGAEGFSAALLDRIPAGLILLLPVMALVLKVLYPLSLLCRAPALFRALPRIPVPAPLAADTLGTCGRSPWLVGCRGGPADHCQFLLRARVPVQGHAPRVRPGVPGDLSEVLRPCNRLSRRVFPDACRRTAARRHFRLRSTEGTFGTPLSS